jgi:hypothetical protein
MRYGDILKKFRVKKVEKDRILKYNSPDKILKI